MSTRAVFLSVVLAVALAGPSRAQYLYPWSAMPLVSDPSDPGINASKDILGAWYAADGAFRYFRLDVAAPVTNTLDGAAMVYGFYMDGRPSGGQNDSSVNYIPAALSGIDFITDSHFGITGSFRSDYHIWGPYGGFYNYSEPYAHQHSENGGRTLEWKVPVTAEGITDQFTFWAASIDLGNPTVTHDITGGFYVPEPAGVLLLLAASVGLLRRRA